MLHLQSEPVVLLLHVVRLRLVPLLQRPDDLVVVLLGLQDGLALLQVGQLRLKRLHHQLGRFKLRHQLKK